MGGLIIETVGKDGASFTEYSYYSGAVPKKGTEIKQEQLRKLESTYGFDLAGYSETFDNTILDTTSNMGMG